MPYMWVEDGDGDYSHSAKKEKENEVFDKKLILFSKFLFLKWQG